MLLKVYCCMSLIAATRAEGWLVFGDLSGPRYFPLKNVFLFICHPVVIYCRPVSTVLKEKHIGKIKSIKERMKAVQYEKITPKICI